MNFKTVFKNSLVFSFISILETSSITQIAPPRLVEDPPVINHVNVVLQCLFHSPPVRHIIFDDSMASANPASSLGLGLSKMHIDRKSSSSVSTETSIFFKDGYLKHASEPFDPRSFLEWSIEELSETAREAFQIEQEITKSSLENDNVLTVSESRLVIEVEPRFASLGAFFKDFSQVKTEPVVLTKNGRDQNLSLQVSKSFTRLPKILTFALGIPLKSRPNPPVPFTFPGKFELNSVDFELFAAILFDPNFITFSTVLLERGSKWMEVKDCGGSVKLFADERDAFEKISNYGYMVFYQDAQWALENSQVSPVPGVELLMQTAQTETINFFSRALKRQTSNESTSSSPSIERVPSKTKNMPTHPINQAFQDSPINRDNLLSGSRSFEFISKTPPPADPGRMGAILVPRNFGGVKIEWGTDDSAASSSSTVTQKDTVEEQIVEDDEFGADGHFKSDSKDHDHLKSDDSRALYRSLRTDDPYEAFELLSARRFRTAEYLNNSFGGLKTGGSSRISGDQEFDYIDYPKMYHRSSQQKQEEASVNVIGAQEDFDDLVMTYEKLVGSTVDHERFTINPEIISKLSRVEIRKGMVVTSGGPSEQPFIDEKSSKNLARKRAHQKHHQQKTAASEKSQLNEDPTNSKQSGDL